MFVIMVINHHSEKLAPLAFAVVSVEVKAEQKQQLQELLLQLNKLATYQKILKLVKQVLLLRKQFQFHPYLPASLVILLPNNINEQMNLSSIILNSTEAKFSINLSIHQKK